MAVTVRKAAVAGQFYPGDARELAAQVAGFLEEAPVRPVSGTVRAVMVPHAGYMYSGRIAAYAYNTVAGGTYDAVVVIAPSHQEYFRGVSVWDGAYETPLGITAVDPVLTGQIAGMDGLLQIGSRGHGAEHSLEVQIPFLQTVLPGVPVVPLVMGEQSPEACRTLGHVLAGAAADRSLLVVASSDLSHFHPYEDAVKRDARVLERVAAFDIDGLLQGLADGGCEACGGGPVAAALQFSRLQGADCVQVLQYANSGDVTGDTDGVVGYAAAAVYRAG